MEGLYIPPRTQKWSKMKIMLIVLLVLFILLFLTFIAVFVILPIVFMNSISLQEALVFTRFDLPTKEEYFEHFPQPGFKNRYITVKDIDGITNVSIGLWHMLPTTITYEELQENNFDFDEALRNSSYDIMLYMHGTGESRSDSVRKYRVFRHNFHVIAFDYRSYGDSSRAMLTEDAVVNDCVQIYKWLLEQTNSTIFVWGHSLGTALATRTVSILKEEGISPAGLILECPFTSFREELPEHKYGKVFAWLPWFKQTILNPLQENGFIFNTEKNIMNTTCPIMFLHAQDDEIVPIKFSYRLKTLAENRPNNSTVVLHEFEAKFKYNHYFIYQDQFFQYYVMFFMDKCKEFKRTSEFID